MGILTGGVAVHGRQHLQLPGQSIARSRCWLPGDGAALSWALLRKALEFQISAALHWPSNGFFRGLGGQSKLTSLTFKFVFCGGLVGNQNYSKLLGVKSNASWLGSRGRDIADALDISGSIWGPDFCSRYLVANHMSKSQLSCNQTVESKPCLWQWCSHNDSNS